MTQAQKAEFAMMWVAGRSVAEISACFSIKDKAVTSIRRRMGLEPRRDASGKPIVRATLPELESVVEMSAGQSRLTGAGG